MFSIVASSTPSFLPRDSQHGVISLALSSRVLQIAVGFNGCKFRVQRRQCLLMRNKLFCSNTFFCSLIYSKFSAQGLPTWSYFFCQVFQGFHRLQQVSMAARFGCEKDSVLSCETNYFTVMFSIVASSTPNCLPIDSQAGVISLAKSSRAFTEYKGDNAYSCKTNYFTVMFCIVAWSTPRCLPRDFQHGVIFSAKSRAFTFC